MTNNIYDERVLALDLALIADLVREGAFDSAASLARELATLCDEAARIGKESLYA